MAKNIIIRGVEYENIPYIRIPQADGSGMAKFVDTSEDTVTPGTLLSGYTAHGADGEPITGTKTTITAELLNGVLTIE
ncbi:MAG: hypothetical protein E7332_06470 [Clostridiales bacterium]|nr:hypothetical protein [Clostridiales bacterium]